VQPALDAGNTTHPLTRIGFAGGCFADAQHDDPGGLQTTVGRPLAGVANRITAQIPVEMMLRTSGRQRDQ
jgi:hypothetical protein